MTKPIRVTPVPKDPPDLDRFVAALLALAIARVESDRKAAKTSLEADAPAGGDDG